MLLRLTSPLTLIGLGLAAVLSTAAAAAVPVRQSLPSSMQFSPRQVPGEPLELCELRLQVLRDAARVAARASRRAARAARRSSRTARRSSRRAEQLPKLHSKAKAAAEAAATARGAYLSVTRPNDALRAARGVARRAFRAAMDAVRAARAAGNAAELAAAEQRAREARTVMRAREAELVPLEQEEATLKALSDEAEATAQMWQKKVHEFEDGDNPLLLEEGNEGTAEAQAAADAAAAEAARTAKIVADFGTCSPEVAGSA